MDAAIPNWIGPAEQVDLLWVFHVSYYIEEPGKSFKHMMEWLKPGGKLIIAHTSEDFPFARLGE